MTILWFFTTFWTNGGGIEVFCDIYIKTIEMHNTNPSSTRLLQQKLFNFIWSFPGIIWTVTKKNITKPANILLPVPVLSGLVNGIRKINGVIADNRTTGTIKN